MEQKSKCQHEWTKARNILADERDAVRYDVQEMHRQCKKCKIWHIQLWGVSGANGKEVYLTNTEYNKLK